MKEATLDYVGMVADTEEYFMVLRETEGDQALVITIGSSEAAAVQLGAERAKLPRPLPHDLMVDLLSYLDAPIPRVVIHEIRDGTYIASLEVDTPKGLMEIDCRTSDAVALALRAQAPILVGDEVFERAGVHIDDIPRPANEDDDEEGPDWVS